MERCKSCNSSNTRVQNNEESFCAACGEVIASYGLANQSTVDKKASSSSLTLRRLDTLSQKLLIAPDDKMYAKELLKTYCKELSCVKWPTETAVSLLYIVSRHRRPDWLLTDYIEKLALDHGKVFRVYKHIRNTIHLQTEQWLDPEGQLPVVFARIYAPIVDMFAPSGAQRSALNANDLRQLTKRIFKVAIEHGYEVGRSIRPLIAACMVIASDALLRGGGAQTGQEKSKRCRTPKANWNTLASEIHCGASTIQSRHTEVVNLLLSSTRSLPWLSHAKITRSNLFDHISDILAFDGEMPHLSDNEAPAYLRAQQQRGKRLQQIKDAVTCYPEQLDDLDVETRMIYFLIQSGKFLAPALENMSGSQIRASVACLYDEQLNPNTGVNSPHDLDRIDVDENDLPDHEASQYII